MKGNYSPKLAVSLLALAVSVVLLSGQLGQAAAVPVSAQYCYPYYDYYDVTYYGYYYPYYYYCRYGYYYDYYYSTQPTRYQLTVNTDPSDIGSVSGSGTYDQGTMASFSIARSIIQTSPDTRYFFSHWAGDYSGVGTSGSLTMNGPKKVIAIYQLQYHLDVNVQPLAAPLPQGAGWYNAGDMVTLATAGSILGGEAGSRLVFQGWAVDGESLQGGVSLMLKMDAPHVVTSQYKTQHYLKVLTDQGAPYGEGWYDEGSSAQVFVSTPPNTNYGVSIIFDGWRGDIQSSSQSTTVSMDRAKTVIASWRSDPTVLNLTIALGIIAAFLAGAGILAYVALNRTRFGQLLNRFPKKQEYVPPAAPSKVTKKSLPLRRKRVPNEEQEESSA